MKVLGINSSARRDGNTAILIDHVFQELNKEGIETELIQRAAVVCDMNPGLMTHKVGSAVAAVRRAGALQAIDAMNHFFLNHEMFVAGSVYWNMAFLMKALHGNTNHIH